MTFSETEGQDDVGSSEKNSRFAQVGQCFFTGFSEAEMTLVTFV